MLKDGIWVVVACSVALWTATAHAQESECLSKRAAAAGKYQKCVQKWQSRCYGYNSSCGDGAKLSKCREKFAAVWPKLQALTGTSCDMARFVDNENGTVTDNLTGLVWEKKTDDSSEHDKDNVYTWGAAENGTAFTVFLSSLNAGGGFAGANGWRLPTFAELQTILLPEPYPCVTSPCIDTAFGATQSNFYWSATTLSGVPSNAWYVTFYDGGVFSDSKTDLNYVRAVRGGL
jgi:hypothetical protein